MSLVKQNARQKEDAPEVPAGRERGLRLGHHLKRERKLKGMRLVDVAEAAGISPSLISKIEHNKLNPSLSALHRIAKALGTSVSALFALEEQVDSVVLRPGERAVVAAGTGIFDWEGIEAEIVIPHAHGRQMQGFVFEMQPGGHSNGVIEHEGEECGFVIEGELELIVNGHQYLLGPGDSFFFHSTRPHSYRNPSKGISRVVWINTPPTF
jgi:transcriptional regulator with XRE-family HTH domain